MGISRINVASLITSSAVGRSACVCARGVHTRVWETDDLARKVRSAPGHRQHPIWLLRPGNETLIPVWLARPGHLQRSGNYVPRPVSAAAFAWFRIESGRLGKRGLGAVPRQAETEVGVTTGTGGAVVIMKCRG